MAVLTGQELYEHVRQLAQDLDATVWVCANCYPKQPAGKVFDNRAIFLTAAPDTPDGYLLALHEMGHLAAHGWNGHHRLDEEAWAWRWALEHSLIPLGPEEWAGVLWRIKTYANDRRYKRTEDFNALLAEAERNTL